MERSEMLEMLENKDFSGMTVKDVLIWANCNLNGNRAIYNIRTKMYLGVWSDDVLNMIPKKVTFHKGYGYGQINTVVRVFIPK